MRIDFSAKQYLGILVYDIPRAVRTAGCSDLWRNRLPWVQMCNRDQTLIQASDGLGVHCDWQWTSNLYLAEIFSSYGRWLYRRALHDFPIRFSNRSDPARFDSPQVSFVIGHRGRKRLPLLLTTLKTIAAQQECRFECIVVEQDNAPLIKDELPSWVRYIHTPPSDEDMAYSRSRAFNVGAGEARADFLIFHDNDMLVPSVYASELYKYYNQGVEVVNLKRFIFYLNRESTAEMCGGRVDTVPKIETIVQNLEAGGSIGISRQAFFAIGGFDERFVGWGGEDNEFWERAQTRRVYPYGYLPLVHLWHEPQPGKENFSDAPGVSLYQKISEQPVQERIRNLRASQ